MSRVQHSKPSRRLGWAAAALVLLALPTAAQAQGFFFLFGSPSPYEIERRLEAAGYVVTGPLTLRGDVYLADVVVRGEGPERLVIDAQSGRIVERYRGRADRWREAAAPPPSAWGDDPQPVERAASAGCDRPRHARRRTLSRRRSPMSSRRPRQKAKPKIAETKPKPTPKPTPVANVNNPPPAAVVPPPAAQDAGRAAARPSRLRPPPLRLRRARRRAPLRRRRVPLRPRAPSPASIEAAKADAPSVAKPPPLGPAAAPAKSKAVNDIPVTPLD